MDRKKMARTRGFTLVELLVVVAIIGLLAAILLPSLANARLLAQGAACLSNMHNIGMALLMYQDGNRGYFPTSYCYVDGDGSTGGYYQWTAIINPSDYSEDVDSGKYPKHDDQYLCPSHTPGGWAPTNFTSGRIPNPPYGQVAQTASLDDKQAPRLSYVANEIVMPRKKYSAAHDASSATTTKDLCLVRVEEIASAQNTILLSEFSNSSNCIYGSSVGGGATYKSHRPTNGIKTASGVFDGEGYAAGAEEIHKLTADEAQAAIDAVLADKSAAASNHHISYINPTAHGSGSNYAFVDGHAGKFALGETLDPDNYMWGRKVYSCVDKPEIQDN